MILSQHIKTECGKALRAIDTLTDLPSCLQDVLKARVIKIRDSKSSYLDIVGINDDAENILALAFQPIRNISKPAEDTDFDDFHEFRVLMNSLEVAQLNELREKTWALFQSRLTEAVVFKNLPLFTAGAI